MQVSKLLVIFCLAMLAAVLYIASPAIALEHPWEEGETPGGGNDSPGTSDPFPSGGDTIQTPLFSSTTQGTIFWWFELILSPEVNTNAVLNSSVVTPADNRATNFDHRASTNGSMK